MQPKQTTSNGKRILGVIVITILAIIAVPIIVAVVLFVSHGSKGANDAKYMKEEMAKVTLSDGINQGSTNCRDVELRQECYFTYTTTLSKAEATDNVTRSFTDAGYARAVNKTSSYDDKYSIGVFQNNSANLYAKVTYHLDSELAPANQTHSRNSQVEIQMYKL